MTAMVPAWVNGELLPMGKLLVHQQGLRHKAVSVFVLRGDQMLLQRRALSKYHTPGLWANTCCTHPLWEEDSAECAVRRLDEELGLTGVTPEFRKTLEYRADVGGGLIEHEVVDVFCAEAEAGQSFTPNSDEVMDTRWVAFAELEAEIAATPDRFTPWLQIYMRDHADKIFGGRMAVSETA